MKAKSGSRLHMFFYWGLFVLLGISIAGFILSFYYPSFWEVFKQAYFIVLLVYCWYIFILLFLGERKPLTGTYNNEAIAVLIPTYNEEPELLTKCINSVRKCDGNITIFVLDDGSTKGITPKKMATACKKFNVNYIRFDTNRGKRHALTDGVKMLGNKYDYVVTIDSDTVLAQDAIVQLVAPMCSDFRIGACTGNVLLLNEKQNWLTRMVGAYYWLGLNIFKQAQSTFGFVVCCSGCISAYRGGVIAQIIDEFVTQEFRGEPCTHSEDRYLTNLVLRDGFYVKYADKALSYTYTPNTVKGFLKQQQRWKRGYIRESTFTLSYAWRTRKMLFAEVICCELTIPFLAFGLMAQLILVIARYPSEFATVILPYWIIFMFVRYSPVFLRAPSKIPGLLIYAVFYDLFLYWQNIYALFTTKNKNWLTR